MIRRLWWRTWPVCVILGGVVWGCALTPKLLKESTLDDYYPVLSAEQYDSLSSLENTSDILQFIEDYWYQRDPSPGTLENEDRDEYSRRLQYANDHFPDRRGWGRSDRKRVYLVHGPPLRIERSEYTTVQISTFATIKSLEVWLYMIPGKPATFASRGDQLFPGEKRFIFADISGVGEYKLVYSSEDGGDIDPRLFGD